MTIAAAQSEAPLPSSPAKQLTKETHDHHNAKANKPPPSTQLKTQGEAYQDKSTRSLFNHATHLTCLPFALSF